MIGAQSITFDESDRILLASLPLQNSLLATSKEGLHALPLLILVLRPFVTPLNEMIVRVPSMLLGVFTVAIFGSIARRWLGSWAGIAALVLLTISPFHIWFSRMATMYSLMLCGVAGSFWAFGMLMRRPHLIYWIMLGGFTFIGVFTHHFALSAPLIQLIYLIINFKRFHRLLPSWAATQALAHLPLAVWLLWGSQFVGVYYIGTAGQKPPALIEPLWTFWNYSFGYTGESSVWIVLALIAFAVVVGVGVYRASRGEVDDGMLLIVWTLTPIVLSFAMSFRLPMFVDRYMSPAFLGFVLLLVVGLGSKLLEGWRRNLVLVVLVIISALNVNRIYFDQQFYAKEDWRGASAYLQAREKKGDVIVLPHLEQILPLLLYYHGGLEFKGVTLGRDVNKMDDLVRGASRVWTFSPHNQDLSHLLAACPPFDPIEQAQSVDHADWLKRNAPNLIERKEFPCITVSLYDVSK